MTASGFLLGARRRVKDVGIQIEWDDAALTEPIETTLGYFGFAPLNKAAAAPDVCPLRLTFSMHEPPLEVPSQAEALSESPEGLRFHRLGETLYLHFKGTVVRLEPQQGTAYGTLATEKTTLRDALLFCLFFYSAVILLYYRGLRTMHAACLTQGDAGCLFIGESDSGKSTLAMRLVESGWHYLSDDSVLLSREGGGIEAYPLRRDFCLDPEAEAVFPQVGAHWQPHLADVRKQRLSIESLYPAQAAAQCTVRTLVFPRIVDAAESRLVPLASKEALLGLLHHSGALAVLDAPTAAAHLEDLKLLTRQAQSYTLLAGRDLRDDPAAAAALFDDVVERRKG
ncbi:MAG: hypothetical protein ACR2GR_08200 [Rhodothermales bacterium]